MRPRTGVFLLVSLTLWGVALSTGDRVCHLLAAIMSLMMLTGIVSVIVTLFTLKVDLTSARKRVLRGQTVLVKVSVRKRSLIPVSLIEIDITSPQGLNDIGRITISAASMRGREYRYTIACAHRGVYQVGIRQIRVTDVFGLFSFERPIRRKGLRLTVLPQVYEISPIQIKPVDDGPQGRIRNTDDLASPSGVRAWQDGDSLKKVHWSLTAR